jgi:P4 family phage/plasmid primase-like protien
MTGDPMNEHAHHWERLVKTGAQVELAQYMLASWSESGEVVWSGDFYQYDRALGVWKLRDHDLCRCDVLALHGRAYGVQTITATGQVKTYTLRLTNQVCNSVLSIAASFAKSRASANGLEFFDHTPAGVMCKGGFLTIEDGNVVYRPPRPDDRQRLALDITYKPDAPGPMWRRALVDWFGDDVDGANKAALLSEFVGAALFGMATRYQKALFIIGVGGNGKSQLLEVLSALFPKEHVQAVRPQDWGSEYQRAQLAGAMINMVAELPSSSIAESGSFKAIITGDPTSARQIYQRPFTFRPRCAHIFSANEYPQALDTSDGFWRRVLVLTMNRRFDGTPEEIHELARRIIDQELEGVLAWAAQGARRLMAQNGYTRVASCEAALTVWRRESDPIASWVDRRTAPSTEDNGGMLATELFRDYRAWSEAHSFPVLNLNHFSRSLARLLGPPKHSNKGNLYPLGLKPRE